MLDTNNMLQNNNNNNIGVLVVTLWTCYGAL